MNEPIKVFLSYSHKDEDLRQELISHLSGLQHQGLIEPWHDRNISAGSEWAEQIDENLEQADIILFLVSSDFITSRYCYSVEMKRALERHRAKTACTIPVIIRDCDWKSTDLHQLNGIPRDNRHVTGWGDKYGRDSAWRQVSEEIGKVAKQIWAERSAQIAPQKAKARQQFRTKAEIFYADGVLSPTEQKLLNRTRQELSLEELEAEEILRMVAAPYQQRQTEYRQTLIAELAWRGELNTEQRELLQTLQMALGISDCEAKQIHQECFAEKYLELRPTISTRLSLETPSATQVDRKLDTKTIKIFLASSSELKADREDFEIFINRENKKYVKNGIFLELNLWEDFLDAMSPTRLQSEYNKVIQESDVFVSLFHTKVGKYTEEEFQKAFETFKKAGKPLIFTYFKNAAINPADITDSILSLLSFKRKLKDLGHFHTNYQDINDLKYQFGNQLPKFILDFASG